MDEQTEEQITEQPIDRVSEPIDTVSIPPQESAQDTSNWEDRPVTAPNGRLIIETFGGDEEGTVISKEEL